MYKSKSGLGLASMRKNSFIHKVPKNAENSLNSVKFLNSLTKIILTYAKSYTQHIIKRQASQFAIYT